MIPVFPFHQIVSSNVPEKRFTNLMISKFKNIVRLNREYYKIRPRMHRVKIKRCFPHGGQRDRKKLGLMAEVPTIPK